MTVQAIDQLCLREYGVPPTAEGARRFERQCRPTRKITSAGQYVAAVRGCARTCHLQVVGEGRVDGRLVAVGWNHMSPRAWLDLGLEEFLEYWDAAVVRPDVVGSDHNPHPEDVYAAMRQGIPASTYLALSCVPGVLGRGSQRITWARMRRLRRAARAVRRTSMHDIQRWSLRALSLLGRLCPELQRSAVEATERRFPEGLIRARDIQWDAVARVQRQLVADKSGRTRVAWATGTRQGNLFEAYSPGTFVGPDYVSAHRKALVAWLSPGYPDVNIAQASQLARGISPSELSGGLTRREAHHWLTKFPDWHPGAWLLYANAVEWGSEIVEIPVARWLVDVHHRGDWSALTKTRTARFGGQVFEFEMISRLDEVRPHHLVNGPRTSVETVFRYAAEERAGVAAYRQCDAVCSTLPRHWPPLPEGVRLLCTPAAIVARGDAHRHCVGMYVPEVRAGRSWIVAVDIDGAESTALLDQSRRVLQHYGPSNSSPSAACTELLQRWIAAPEKAAA